MVVICTGADPIKLDVPGAQLYWGKGITSCAICDAPYHKDQDVLVVGGGDSAVEEALQLALYAKNVKILVRKDKMRAAPSMQEKLKSYSNVSVIYNTVITEVSGDKEKLTGATIKNVVTGQTEKLSVTGLFLAIGHEPNTASFKKYLKCDVNGYIDVKSPTQQTSLEGVYAAGDVSDFKYKQAGVAAGDGIKAGLDALNFLREIGFTEKIASQVESKFFDAQEGVKPIKIEQIKSKEQFNELVLKSELPVIVDFYAPYCPSCMQMIPVVEAVAARFVDNIKFFKFDTSVLPEVALELGVSKVPYIIVFNKGKNIKTHNQVMTKRELINFVQALELEVK